MLLDAHLLHQMLLPVVLQLGQVLSNAATLLSLTLHSRSHSRLSAEPPHPEIIPSLPSAVARIFLWVPLRKACLSEQLKLSYPSFPAVLTYGPTITSW